MTTLLNRTINALGLNPELARKYRRPCAARLGFYRRNPGDLRDEFIRVGMAIAAHEVPPSPGWVPEVQRRAVEYARIAERISAEVSK